MSALLYYLSVNELIFYKKVNMSKVLSIKVLACSLLVFALAQAAQLKAYGPPNGGDCIYLEIPFMSMVSK